MDRGWVALLRAVNLGTRNKVPMAELRALLERDGFGAVRSHIASGNLLFTAAAKRTEVAARVEALILDAFSVRTVAVVRSFAELSKVAASHPFGEDVSHTFVTFLAAKPPAAAVRALGQLDTGDDEIAVSGKHVFLRYPNGVQGARLSGAALEKALGVAGTARNWRTVTRLAAMTAE
jgi:uncharacterized protein (DUF1697 family)